MKKSRRLAAILLCVITLLTSVFVGTMTVSAAANPYGEWQTIGGVTTRRCTWYAWKMAYERTGVALPGLGNGGQWYDNAKKYGYSVGSVAVPNCIAVWTDSGYGHVGFVESVTNGKMRILEGGRSDLANNGSGGIGTATLSATVGTYRNKGTQRLQGFIYLKQVFNVSYESLSAASITEKNAQIISYIKNPNRLNISQVGAYLWDSKGNLIANHREVCNRNLARFQQGFNVQTEGRVTLQPGSTYTCQFYAISGGKVAYSEKRAFKTAGGKKIVMGTSKITSLNSHAPGKVKVYWNQLNDVSGYQIRMATNSSFKNAFTATLKSTSVGAEVKNLSKGRIYYVQVRAYWNDNGKTKYNSWSTSKKVLVRIW